MNQVLDLLPRPSDQLPWSMFQQCHSDPLTNSILPSSILFDPFLNKERNGEKIQMSNFQHCPDTREALATLRKLYILSDEEILLQYLYEHPIDFRLLLEAAPQLKQYFGEEEPLSVNIVRDDEEGPSVTANVIVFDKSLKEAEEALQKFDQNWWIQNCSKSTLVFDYKLPNVI